MKRIGLLFLIVIAAAAVLIYYFWQEATRLPDWYKSAGEQETALRSGADIRNALKRFDQKLSAITGKPRLDSGEVQLTLSQDELNDLIVDGLVRKLGEEQILDVVKGAKTEIKDGRLETGLVLNISELPLDQLDFSRRAAVEKLLQNFTFLKEQDVYVGLQGTPQLIDGKLVIDDSYQIKLGGLTFSPAELAGKIGVTDPAKAFELDLGDLQISDISLGEKQATVTAKLK